MRLTHLCVLCLLLASSARGVTPRVTFDRVVPPPVDLGSSEEVVLLGAAGDDPELETFVEALLHEINRSRTLRAGDGRGRTASKAPGLRVTSFACDATVARGEAGGRGSEGERVRRNVEWVDAACSAAIEVLSGGKALASFEVRREGTSPRAEKAGDDERTIARRQAARYTAVAAAERITPLRVRESIVLAEDAPAFEEGLALIEIDRLSGARAAWERALASHPRSAPLHFNLAAVCEALGDPRAAERHYSRAVDLAPSEPRYARELRAFRARTRKAVGSRQ